MLTHLSQCHVLA